jgi:CRP/FNR family transcriptional regulator, cyclic AMP receptor protein
VHDFWHLHNFDWLGELSAAEGERLRQQSVQREYRRGQLVYGPVPQPPSVYLLERGLVRIYRASGAGTETTFGYVKPGEIFGELAVFTDQPRESYAQAVRPSIIWQLPRGAVREILKAHPGIVIAVTKQIGDRLKRIESRVENLVFRDARARVARILLELAEDFGHAERGMLTIDLSLSQEELATLVGATRQTVNAALRDLEQDGLVRRGRRRLVLLRPGALRLLLKQTH